MACKLKALITVLMLLLVSKGLCQLCLKPSNFEVTATCCLSLLNADVVNAFDVLLFDVTCVHFCKEAPSRTPFKKQQTPVQAILVSKQGSHVRSSGLSCLAAALHPSSACTACTACTSCTACAVRAEPCISHDASTCRAWTAILHTQEVEGGAQGYSGAEDRSWAKLLDLFINSSLI